MSYGVYPKRRICRDCIRRVCQDRHNDTKDDCRNFKPFPWKRKSSLTLLRVITRNAENIQM